MFARKRYFAGSTWYVKSMKGMFVKGKHLFHELFKSGPVALLT